MGRPLIAIGLDAADPHLIEEWMAAGHLPRLQELREGGVYQRLRTFEYYRAETPWTTFLTGCAPQQTGYWSPLKFHPADYRIEEVQAYGFDEHEPFYAHCPGRQVAVFDMPQSTLCEQVDGIQVLAWGAHSPMTASHSQPADIFEQIVEVHGAHPMLRRDHAPVLDWPALQQLQSGLATGIERRAKICADLLQQQPWDLFLTVFGEPHAAGHFFWHLSRPDHPLHRYFQRPDSDPLRATFQAIDSAVGEILEAAPADANVMVFAAHGMGANVMDLPSMVFLPEFLYRLNFPGQIGLAGGRGRLPQRPMMGLRARKGWFGTMWRLKHDRHPVRRWLRQLLPGKVFKQVNRWWPAPAGPDLVSPFDLQAEGHPLYFQTPLWYREHWPQMRAFALPSFSEGYVRINLKGREAEGIVEPSDYDAVCDEYTEQLYQLKDARSGQPMVQDVIRTRPPGSAPDPKHPDADLVVIWQDQHVTDSVEAPGIGRIGPVPYLRTGSHRSDGFLVMAGPDIAAPTGAVPVGHALDLAPTVLDLMEIAPPEHFRGQPLAPRRAPLAGQR